MEALADKSAVDSRCLDAWRQHRVAPGEPQALRAELARGSLIVAARANAVRFGTREAIRVGDESLTHRELDDTSRRVATHLQTLGAGYGGRVLLAGPNCCDLLVCYLAALRIGASVTLASPSLTSVELAALVESVDPAVVAGSADVGAVVADPARWLELGPGQKSLRAAVASTRPGRDAPVKSSTVAHLAFTSGTTGSPKATPLTHGNILASVRAVIAAWQWASDDVLVHGLPLQHAHGLTAFHLTLLTGSRSVVLPSFDPDELCRAVAEHRATVLFGVPATHEALLDSPMLPSTDWSHLRLVTSGSAPLAPVSSDALTDVLGARPLERYGLTEAGFVLSNPYAGPRIAGSVGFPLPGVEVDIIDDTLAPLPDGEHGEIVVRGPQVFAGYLGQPADTSPFIPGRWFRTGDIGCRNPSTGRFSITGRLKELIITGGMNVYPREIELAIEAHEGVRAAAVVGLPSTRWGEQVTAFIEAHDDFDTEALLQSLRDRLAGYKRPKRCVVVSQLPRNHMGKILRSQLRDLSS